MTNYGYKKDAPASGSKTKKPSGKKNCKWVCEEAEKKTVKKKMDERSTVKTSKDPVAVPSFRNKPL